jgi:hypothetical protein
MKDITEFEAVGIRNCTPLFSDVDRDSEGRAEYDLCGDVKPPSTIDSWASEKVMDGLCVGEGLES